MNRDRLWTIGGLAAIAVVALAGWFLGISPIVAQASAANDQVASLNSANAANVSKLASLKAQYSNLGPLNTTLSSLRQSIPTDADMSAFITEINSLSSKYGVVLTTVTVNDATVFAAPTPVTPVTPNADGSTPTPTPTPTATPTTADTTTAAAPAATGLAVVPVVVNVDGSFENVVKFLGDLQTGTRLYLVGTISISPGAANNGDDFTGVLTGTVFALPTTIPASANLGNDNPTPTPTPTETPTPSMTPTAPPLSTSTPTPTDTPKP
jgi:hypothetical protein